jgi:hypothetical protein
MIPETSAATVAVRVPANGFARVPSLGAVASGATLRVPADAAAVSTARGGLRRGIRRMVSALGDILGLVAVAYAFPLVILAIGIPIALLVRLAIWIVRAI